MTTQGRELIIKPSFTNEIMGLPKSLSSQVWEKINFLVADPLPDGHNKKKLHQKDLYRLRIGNYRLFYTLGDRWICLLGIRKRDESTYGHPMQHVLTEKPGPLPEEVKAAPELTDEATESQEALPAFRLESPAYQLDLFTAFPKAPAPKQLPQPLAVDWLRSLQIPEAHFPKLLVCQTEDALLAADVPAGVLQRILDNLYPRPIEEVLEQPDLIVQDTRDLALFQEGTLSGFLLRLDAEQKRYCDWALKGPTMLKGGPGTGKSTVALYRVQALLNQPGSTKQEKVLFTTYTRSLMTVSQQLLQQLLPPQQMARVRVATCDQIAWEIVSTTQQPMKTVPSGYINQQLELLRKDFLPQGDNDFDRKLRARALEKLGSRYLLEEMEWVIEGRGLMNRDDYLTASRPGRGVALGNKLRESVWELYEALSKVVNEGGYITWGRLRQQALQLVQNGAWKQRYDYVVIDEAQDLTPVALALMAELARSETGLFLAADNKQSIYSRNFTYKMAHPRLQLQGRTATLKQNYRSTREIEEAAFPLLQPEQDETLEKSDCIHSGPRPVWVRCATLAEEAVWAALFIRQMSRHLRLKMGASAILVPTKEIGEALAQHLVLQGLPAKYFPGKELHLESPEVKVITLHSAKGLEFPTVVICGLQQGTYPIPEDSEDVAEYEERMRIHRRLLYVGMTRSMRGLMVILPKESTHPAIESFDLAQWNVLENV